MSTRDVADDSFVEYFEEANKKSPKFKVGDNVRISKYKNIFAKGYTLNWSEEGFAVNKVQNTVPWTYLINDLNGEEIKGSFYEKELQKTDQKEFRIEKAIKKKGDKLYVKWKGYNNSFNSWVDKKKYKMGYVPTYSEVEEEIASVTLNLSNYVTQKEFKNVTKVDTSDFALKANVAEIKKKVDDNNVDKINFVDELQGKSYIEDSYLYLNQKYKYFKYDKTDTQKLLSWQSAGISNEKLTRIKGTNSPSLLFEKAKPYLKIRFFKFLAQRTIYTHKRIVNIYLVYLMPDIADAKGVIY